MSPDHSLASLLHHSDVLARRVNAGEINDSAASGLLESLSRHYCDVSCRDTQLASATRNYEHQRVVKA